MANIHIRRDHQLGLDGARKVAWKWAEHAESEFDMQCAYEEGDDTDVVHFNRTGAKGTLRVAADHFDLDAQLGFLLGAFKDRIESEIVKNLDELLEKKKKPATKSATGSKKK
ncbi:polyhydroxyalkanoic acid system family protein [Hydrogenophaga sp. RWCD_12]|uniref:polyhydroxyalkanoic acid system family protein n=1 Tax=Hydrogenophaga sp. RWCD_12 TaxID=3391190 RepID=UPI003984F7C2